LLLRERFVVVGRKKHPALQQPGKLDLSLPQLHVAPRGGTAGKFERKTKLRRNIVMFLPHYLTAPWVLASSDLLAALPERVARRFAEVFPLQVVPVAIPHEPMRLLQVWHPRRQGQSAHQWLRAEVLRAAQ
jgi:DNA-binding transcriptional LysR family regulator